MSGYDWDAGMSNNAVLAYDDGKTTAGRIAKTLGVLACDVEGVLNAQEWHHTSGKFNKTMFYDQPSEEEIERIKKAARNRLSQAPHTALLREWWWMVVYRAPYGKKGYERATRDLGKCKLLVWPRGFDSFVKIQLPSGEILRRKRRYFTRLDDEKVAVDLLRKVARSQITTEDALSELAWLDDVGEMLPHFVDSEKANQFLKARELRLRRERRAQTPTTIT